MKVIKKKSFPQVELSVDNVLENKEYKVLLIEYYHNEELYRIINEKNEPQLYPSIAFNIVDNSLDKIWRVIPFDEKYYNDEIHDGNGLRYIGPKEFAYNYYFFRDWFNNKKKEKKVLKDFLESYPEYKNE